MTTRQRGDFNGVVMDSFGGETDLAAGVVSVYTSPATGASPVVVLRCVAYGGIYGGRVSVALNGAGQQKLAWVSGNALPSNVSVPPESVCAFEMVYEPIAPSDAANDIVATASLVEDFLNETHTNSSSFTAIRLGLSAVYDAPENHNPSRHIYGVGEKVGFVVEPVLSGAVLSVVKADAGDNVTFYDLFEVEPGIGGSEVAVSDENIYRCPAVGTVPAISLRYNDCVYHPEIFVVEPQRVVTRMATGSGTFLPGDVCMGTLTTINHIGPFHVSFRGVKMYEVVCTNAIPPAGYFATTNFNGNLVHDLDADAGWIHPIGDGNYWTTDEAGRREPYENWSSGSLAWKIPIGWARYCSDIDNVSRTDRRDYAEYLNEKSRPLLIGNREDTYLQVYTIETNGTSSVEKFGWKLTRGRWLPFGTVSRTGGGE